MSSVKDIFIQALEYDSGDERLKFVASACGDNLELRRLVEALLEAEENPASFLDRPALRESMVATADYSPDSAIAEGPGSIIGNYKLLQTIGQGGFGVVYMAEQQEPVRRTVALKIIKPGMDTQEVIARFEAERQALALMNHPNIAKVLDAGTTESGRPYFVMELVKGIPLTQFCDTNNYSPTKRLDLFISICHAVQHAHQKGVIHRDLKPSNVMVTLFDGQPVPKVIDFGISKAISQRLTEKTLFTRYGQMVGTPQYMSPEQAEMSGLDVDTRSDVYSLGVILYELLTGSTPLDVAKLREAGYAEMLRLIKEEEAPKPSSRLTTMDDELTSICEQRSTDPKQLSDLIRRELDWIALKALEKDRNRRYATASELAEDVRRHLDGEPVNACPPTFAYRLTKFARRYRTQAAVATAIVSILLISSVLSWSLYVTAQTARDEAQLASERLMHETMRAHESEELAKKSEESARQSEKKALVAKQQLEQRLYTETIARAANELEKNRPAVARRLLDQINPTTRSWEFNRLKNRVAPLEEIPVSETEILSFNTAPDSDLCVIAETPDTIKVIDLKSRKTLWSKKTSVPPPAVVRFSPLGKYIAVATSPLQRATPAGAEVWSVDGNRIWKEYSDTQLVSLPQFSADAKKVFIAKGHRSTSSIRVLDLPSLTTVFNKETSGLGLGAFDRDARRVVVAFARGFDMRTKARVRCYDLVTGEAAWELEHPVLSVPTLDPTSSHFILGGENHDLVLIDAETGETVSTIRGNLPGVAGITELSPNRDFLLSAGMDGQIGIWDWRTKRVAQNFLRQRTVIPSFRHDNQHVGEISADGKSLEFSPILHPQLDLTLDATSQQISALRFVDTRLQSLDREGYLRSWNLQTGIEESVVGPLGKLWEAAFIPQRNQVAIGDTEGIRVIDLKTLDAVARFPLKNQWWYSVRCSKTGSRIAACCDAGLMLINLDERKAELLDEFGAEIRGIEFLDESTIATVSHGAALHIVDLKNRKSRQLRKAEQTQRSRPICWLPKMSQLVIAVEDEVEFWNVKTGQRQKTFDCEGRLVTEMLSSPDGARIFVGDSDGGITVWSLETDEPLLTLQGHERGTALEDYILGVQEMIVDSEGATLVSGGRDGRICIWESQAQGMQSIRKRKTVTAATQLVNRLSTNGANKTELLAEVRNSSSMPANLQPDAMRLVLNRGNHVGTGHSNRPGQLFAQLRLKPGWLKRLQHAEIQRYESRRSLIEEFVRVTNLAIDQPASSVNKIPLDQLFDWSEMANELASLPLRKEDVMSMGAALTIEHPDCPLAWYIAANIFAANHDWRMARTMFSNARREIDNDSPLGLLVATKLLALETRLSGDASTAVEQWQALLKLAESERSDRARLRIARNCLMLGGAALQNEECVELIEGIDPAKLPKHEVSWLLLCRALIEMRKENHNESWDLCDEANEQLVKRHWLSNYSRATMVYILGVNSEALGSSLYKNTHNWLLSVQPFLTSKTTETHRDWEQWMLHDAVSKMKVR